MVKEYTLSNGKKYGFRSEMTIGELMDILPDHYEKDNRKQQFGTIFKMIAILSVEPKLSEADVKTIPIQSFNELLLKLKPDYAVLFHSGQTTQDTPVNS